MKGSIKMQSNVIQFKKAKYNKKTFDYRSAYGRILARVDEKLDEQLEQDYVDRTSLKQFAYVLVKLFGYQPKATTAEEADTNFRFFCSTKTALSLLTPREFLATFPPDKQYDGERYGEKDYFTTMEAVSSYPQDVPIGKDIMYFLSDYMNEDINIFVIEGMCLTGDMYSLQTGCNMVEDIFEEMGTPVDFVTMHTDPVTKTQFTIQDGRPMVVRQRERQ